MILSFQIQNVWIFLQVAIYVCIYIYIVCVCLCVCVCVWIPVRSCVCGLVCDCVKCVSVSLCGLVSVSVGVFVCASSSQRVYVTGSPCSGAACTLHFCKKFSKFLFRGFWLEGFNEVVLKNYQKCAHLGTYYSFSV